MRHAVTQQIERELVHLFAPVSKQASACELAQHAHSDVAFEQRGLSLKGFDALRMREYRR